MDDLVAKALHAARQHFDEGGFLDSLRGMFSGPDIMSTGSAPSPGDWGNPELASDFFKADKAMRLARELQAKADDVTGSVPARAPLTAPRPGIVKATELAPPPAQAFTPVSVEDLAVPPPQAFTPITPQDLGVMPKAPAIASPAPAIRPIAYSPETPVVPAAAAIDQATSKLTARAPQGPDLNDRQRDLIIRTIAAETSGKSPEESQAIAHVILNRIQSGKYGATPEAVLFARKQFEPWSNPNGANYPMRFTPESRRYGLGQTALDAALGAEDITKGATNFWAPKAQAALGRRPPKWGRTGGVDIGETRFHNLSRAEGGEIHGDEHMNHDDIVAHALHRLRRHFAGEDGSYVDPADNAMPTEPRPLTIYRDNRPESANAGAAMTRDEDTYGPANIAERRARIQELTTPTNYPGDALEAPQGYMTPATAVEWKSGDAGPYAVDASGNTLPLIKQPGMLPMYYDPSVDSIRPAMPGVPDFISNVVGAPLGISAARVVQAARTGARPAANIMSAMGDVPPSANKGIVEAGAKAIPVTSEDVAQAVKTAKQVTAPPQRGILATPDLRQMDRNAAIDIARSEPHLIQDASGQYVGAPRGMTTPEQIQAMRKAFDKDVEAGAVGGDWYERAREFNREISGDNPYRQKLVANEEALWSAQANPDTNLGFGLNARTDYEAGKYGDKYRTGQQARSYGEARRAMDLAKSVEAEKGMMGHNQGPALTDIDVAPSGLSQLGKKTGIYGQHLDPTVAPATTGTNDIWHARGFGYTNQDGGLFSRALTSQEHRFLDYETMLAVDRANANKLAGRSDWTGAEIQAAPWVAGKGRALAQRGNKPLEQGIAEAAQTYPDVAPKYTYSTPIEQIPGANTGLLPNLINADDATKAAFTARADWKDPKGRDALWSELGMPTRYTNDTLGAYRNSIGNVEYNPLEIGRPMSGFGLNEAGNPVANPRMAAGLSMGQAARRLLDFQEGTPWNKFITHGAGPDKTSIHVGIGRNPTRQELDALMELGQKHGLDLTNTEGGVGFINWKKNQTTTSIGKDLRAGLLKEIKSILPDATVQRARFQGDYFDLAEEGVNQLSKANQGKGLATKEFFSTLNRLRNEAPDYYNRILDSEVIAGKARANLERLIEYGGKGNRTDGERLLKIVGEDKLRGLLDRVTKLGYGGLPAIGAVGTAGAVLGSSASKDGSEPGRYD